jgi:uncharacterized membrane protein
MAATAYATPRNLEQAESPPMWPFAVNIILGVWLASTALTIEPHPPALMVSDLLSSSLIIGGSALACFTRYAWVRWLLAITGLWLMCAPLVFWAPTAVSYDTNNLIGSLVVAFSVIVPGIVAAQVPPGPDVPPGWNYNPSAWPQRVGIIACAFLQFFIARYMAAFQLGHTAEIWDPVFGNGTRNVLESDVSKAFPVSDAGLGAVTYLIEALTGFLGGTRRWRTMPWAVVMFGIMIVPVGVVSIVLVVLQPVAVGAWCAWCLITAGLTVIMIGPAIDEVVATGQFLLRARREGQSLWQAFWRGGTIQVRASDQSAEREVALWRQLAGGLELLSIPWNLVVCAVLGLWLMVAPVALGNTGASANNNHLVGALVVTFAVIGFSEAGRGGRLVNLILGTWLLVAPFILNGENTASTVNDLAIGAAVIALSFRRGRILERFGGWDRWIV